MEFLKDVLGEDMYAQFSEKMAGAEGIKLANVADGSYLPKEKFDRERAANQQYKAQVTELQKTIEQLQKGNADVETLKAQLAAANQTIADNAAKMQQTRMHYHMIDKAREAGARDPEMLVRLMDVGRIAETNGEFVGVDDQIKTLKENSAFLFNAPAPNAAGVDPNMDLGNGNVTTNFFMNNAIRKAAGRD